MLALWSGEYETAAAAFERARQLDAAVADDYAIAAITPFAAPEVESPTSITRVAQLLEDVNRSLSEDPNWAAGYAIRGLASLTDEDDIESALADLVEYTRLSIEAETFSSQKTGSVDVWSMTRAATKRYANATVEMVLSTFIHFAVMGQLQLSDDLANRIVNLELPLSVSGIELPGIGAAIEAAAISADGSHIAVLSGDMGSELSLWDATTGANIFSTTIGTPGIGCSSGNPLAYDPRGRTIAAISCDQVFIVDVNTGQFVARIPDAARHQPDLASVAYSQSGNEIVVSTINGWIDVWATETGEHLQSIVPDATAGSVVSAFDEFSNSVLAVGSNNRLSRWDATSGKKIEDVFDIGSTVLTLYPVIGTDLIAATFIDDNRIELIEMGSGRVVQTLIGHRDYILDVCTSTDARYIASAGADGSVLVWDVTTGNLVTILGHQALASSVCFGPDRNTLVSSGWDGTVRVWDVSNETERLIISVTE
jgi:WD40 repeat protein